MATVVKDSRGRSKYWIACYTDSAGRRLKKSTKLTNKKKALEVALSLEHGEHLARSGAVTETRLQRSVSQSSRTKLRSWSKLYWVVGSAMSNLRITLAPVWAMSRTCRGGRSIWTHA